MGSSLFSDFFEALAGGPMILDDDDEFGGGGAGDDFDEDDDDESGMSSDEEAAVEDDLAFANDPVGLGVGGAANLPAAWGLEQFLDDEGDLGNAPCAIM